MSINIEDIVCPICERILGSNDTISKHHLIPKSKGGKHSETILIHNICHQKIHSVFNERELRDDFNTIEKLKNSEEMQKFIKWVAKKDINYYQSNKKMKKR
ncbi:MAG: HNH endonuclease [Saprospiraceae bacterium]|nr:HNH endonuclease [Saprospiraceae bacterium]